MAILSDFDYGRSLHDTQHFTLGQEVQDAEGNRWGYIRIREASGGAHRVMRSTEHGDIMSAGAGVVAAAEAIGSKRLTVAATNNRDFRTSLLAEAFGCLGFISTGPGLNQYFAITERVSATEVRVEVFGSPTGGWETALTTASRFHLWFPGEARQGDGTSDFIEGVLHANALAADVGKFGYVQRSGHGLVALDAGEDAAQAAEWLVPRAAGMVEGLDVAGATEANIQTAIEQLSSKIGRAVADLGGTTDGAVLAALDIPPVGLSRAVPNKTNSYNRVTIGAN